MATNIFRVGTKAVILTVSILFIIAGVAWPATYYVAANGGNDGNPGTLASPWKTITKANSTLRAGDTAFIRTGTYPGQAVSPANSGTANARIVYSNYNNEAVTVTQANTAVTLSNRSYVTIRGITFDGCTIYLTMANGDYNHIEYCTFDASPTFTRFEGFHIGRDSSYNWIHHCTVSRYGEYSGGEDRGDMVYIGDMPNGDNSHNLIEDNHFFYGGHNVFTVNSPYNVIRNNYLHNEEWSNGYGGRIGVIQGGDGSGKWNLIEGNRWCFSGNPPDNTYSPAVKVVSPENIIRNNMFYCAKGPGIQLVCAVQGPEGSDNNYIYNNVFFNNGVDANSTSQAYGVFFKGVSGPVKGAVVKNNIFYRNSAGAVGYVGTGSLNDNTVVSNWMQTGDPAFADANPNVTSPDMMDYPAFTLSANSPCVNAGAFLTTTKSAGSGTRIPVLDAHYFMDGWGIVEGDVIQLQNQTNTAQITAVDYAGNTITVNTSLTWSANQGVSLQYSGAAPDLGVSGQGGVTPPPPLQLAPPENLRIFQGS